MERNLLVLGCSQTKRDTPGLLPAIERYDGSAYRVVRKFLRNNQWPENISIAVLSAKYGLVGGFTGIENYDERMTPSKAKEWAPICSSILSEWASSHNCFYFSLGKDYLPAVMPLIQSDLKVKTEIFEGPIGMKLSQIKRLLNSSQSLPRVQRQLPQAGMGKIHYFLPDWDDLLDPNFDFVSDSFSGTTRKERGDRHCNILMKPQRMCDGILVSLAQHSTSKGPLKKIFGNEYNSLMPINLRENFGLEDNQFLFGDCGAFSYATENEPTISVEQAIAMYELHGFDFGASVDHIPMPKIKREGKFVELTLEERLDRVEITQNNAKEFFRIAKERNVNFTPVGIVQAISPEDYGKITKLYYEIGYRHIAVGGLVPLSDKLVEEIVTQVMRVAQSLNPRPWIHLFGIFRPKLQAKFRELKVDSFDSASYFRKAWLRSDQNYLSTNGEWYAAIRVPMTQDGRTRNKFLKLGLNLAQLENQETKVLKLLSQYDRGIVKVKEVLDAVIEYDSYLDRTSDTRSLVTKYQKTLEDRPWENCNCPFCKETGIHALVFRGANRNKRRGAHNTLVLYESLKDEP